MSWVMFDGLQGTWWSVVNLICVWTQKMKEETVSVLIPGTASVLTYKTAILLNEEGQIDLVNVKWNINARRRGGWNNFMSRTEVAHPNKNNNSHMTVWQMSSTTPENQSNSYHILYSHSDIAKVPCMMCINMDNKSMGLLVWHILLLKASVCNFDRNFNIHTLRCGFIYVAKNWIAIGHCSTQGPWCIQPILNIQSLLLVSTKQGEREMKREQ